MDKRLGEQRPEAAKSRLHPVVAGHQNGDGGIGFHLTIPKAFEPGQWHRNYIITSRLRARNPKKQFRNELFAITHNGKQSPKRQ